MQLYKKILIVFFSFIPIILLASFFNFDNSKAFVSIITFLSITIGFTITALSIIANSSFSKQLYSREDSKDNSKTLLHILVDHFKYSTFLFVTTIILIFIYFFFIEDESKCEIFSILGNNISIPIILKATIWYSTIWSFICFIMLINLFSKFVIKSAKKK